MTSIRKAGGAIAAMAMVLVTSAPLAAADLSAAPSGAPSFEEAATSPWQVRLRALGVLTNNSGTVNGIPGADLSYSDSVIPELDISYFFTKNIAAELILGTTSAKIYTDGAISGLGQVGKTWVLPPTLTLQYHVTDFGAFQPYVGAGVNYTIFYNPSDSGAFSDVKVKNSFGGALQVGFDYMLDEHWGLNVDAKKLFLQPDWKAKLGGTDLSGKAKLDPWLIGAGVTYRF